MKGRGAPCDPQDCAPAVAGKQVRTAIIAIVISIGLASEAQCEGGRFVTFGVGIKSCGEYLLAAEGERKARPAHTELNAIYSMEYLDFVGYANGYLTGSNSVADERQAGQHSDLAGRMTWLETYCRRNPLHLFAIALMKLREYLVNPDQ
jgi:hypothetical protein